MNLTLPQEYLKSTLTLFQDFFGFTLSLLQDLSSNLGTFQSQLVLLYNHIKLDSILSINAKRQKLIATEKVNRIKVHNIKVLIHTNVATPELQKDYFCPVS